MFRPRALTARIFVTLAIGGFWGAALPCLADEVVASGATGLRTQKPLTVGFGLGTPAPAYIGTSLAYQSAPDTQLVVSYGRFWSGDLYIHSVEGALRFQLMDTAFTPVVGGGINSLFFKGQGSIQTLNESSLLLSLFLGFDWAFPDGFRVTSGVNFHVPLRLNFPMLSFGWSL